MNNFEQPIVPSQKIEEPKPLKQEEFSGAQKAFIRGILNVAEVTTLEEARNANWKFDGKYLAENRTPESTNYAVIEREGGEKEITPEMNRKCTICHHPNIKNVSLVSVNGQIVQMGSDCASKLMRFVDTGEIIAESSIRGVRDEQIDIFVDVLDNEDDVERTERKKRKIVASMMSWLNDHVNDKETPEDIKYAIETYNNVGMMPSNDFAKKAAEYYKANRKVLPDEILDDNYLASFKKHIHARLLRGVASHGLVQDDVEQLKRIIDKGKELAKKRVERKLKELEKERMKHELEAQQKRESEILKKEVEKKQRAEARLLERKKFEEMKRLREIDLIHFETFFVKGLIEKGEFNQGEFKVENLKNVELLKDKHGKFTIENNQNELGAQANSYYELETNSDNTRTLKVYVLDQGTKMTSFDEKYFVVVDMMEEFVPKAYDPLKINKVKLAFSIDKSLSNYPISVAKSVIEKARVDMNFIRYSCAEVVMDRRSMKLMVKMHGGDVPLEDMLEQGKIIFIDDDGVAGE